MKRRNHDLEEALAERKKAERSLDIARNLAMEVRKAIGTSLIIGVCYMLWMFQRVFFETSNERTVDFPDLNVKEALTFLPVILLILVMGIFPQVFIKKIEPAAQQHMAMIYAINATQVADAAAPSEGSNNHKN